MILWNLGTYPRGQYLKSQRQQGFTLVEIMMSVILLAVGTALAIPSYQEMVEKRQLTNATEQVLSFVNATQGISSRTNEIVTVSYHRDDNDDWCIGATMGADACDCEETVAVESDYCEIDSQHFVLNQDLASGLELMHSIAGDGSYSFDPIRGLFTDMDDFMTLEMHSRSSAYKLNLMVIATGRVVLCSKDANHAIPGYDVCPVEES